LDPGGIFLGKAAAITIHLIVLQTVLLAGVTMLYGTTPRVPLLLAATCVTATIGLAAVGAILGTMSAGLRVRDSLLPNLMLPMVTPVLIGATQAFAAAYDREPASGWRWHILLAAYGCLYVLIGIVAYDALLEDR